MAQLKGKIKLALDEARMLVLGVQVLVGFQYNNALEPGFASQPLARQALDIASLILLIISLGLLVSAAPFHQLVEGGNCTLPVHRFVSTVTTIALLPFAAALAIAGGTAAARTAGPTAGWIAALAAFLTAALLWYFLGWSSRRGGRPRLSLDSQEKSAMGQTRINGTLETDLHTKIEQALTECRVVLPGAQALLGFQFTATVLEAFKQLPASSKQVHLVALGLMALTIVLLMTPAAFHRIAERGEDSERLHHLTARFLLAAMSTLAMGLAADLFVVLRRVTGSAKVGTVSAVTMLVLAYSFWFGYAFYRRARKVSGPPAMPAANSSEQESLSAASSW